MPQLANLKIQSLYILVLLLASSTFLNAQRNIKTTSYTIKKGDELKAKAQSLKNNNIVIFKFT